MIDHKESIVINAAPAEVWEYVGSPDCWPLFHAKVDQSELISSQGGRVGSIYAMRTRLGARFIPMRCEIADLSPCRRIELRSTAAIAGKKEDHSTVTFDLEDLGTTTKVTERVEMELKEIGIFWRLVVWFISRFGQPQGETTLGRLKKVVEGAELRERRGERGD